MAEIIVRRWQWQDYPAICASSVEIAEAQVEAGSAYPHYPPPDPIHMFQHLLHLMTHKAGWVAMDGETMIGVLALDTATFNWNPHVAHLTNAHFWVAKDYRTGGVAGRLLNQAKTFARETDAVLKIEMTMGVDDPDRLDRWLSMSGLKKTGGVHWFVPPVQASHAEAAE